MKCQEQQVYLVTDDAGVSNFRVTVTERHPALDEQSLVSVIGIVERANAWEDDDANTPCEVEQYLKFYIKWDECCHIHFGTDDHPGYLHLCGAEDWRKHNQLMTELYQWAEKTIPMRL